MNHLHAFLYRYELYGNLRKHIHWSALQWWTRCGWMKHPNHPKNKSRYFPTGYLGGLNEKVSE